MATYETFTVIITPPADDENDTFGTNDTGPVCSSEIPHSMDYLKSEIELCV